jgi:hypothetical protein
MARMPPALVATLPPSGATVLTGEHRVDEPLTAGSASSSSSRVTPGSTTATWLSVVDLEDPVHPLEGDDHASLDRDAGTGQAGPRPAGDKRHAFGGGRLHDGHDLLGRARAHDGLGNDVGGAERLVVREVVVDGARPVDVAHTDDVGQRVDDHRMTFDDRPSGPTAGPDHMRWTSGNVELLLLDLRDTLTRSPDRRPPARAASGRAGLFGHNGRSPPGGGRSVGGVDQSMGVPGVGEPRAGRSSGSHRPYEGPVGQVLVEEKVRPLHTGNGEVRASEFVEIGPLRRSAGSVDGHRVLGRTDDEVAGGLDRRLLEEDLEAAFLATHDTV